MNSINYYLCNILFYLKLNAILICCIIYKRLKECSSDTIFKKDIKSKFHHLFLGYMYKCLEVEKECKAEDRGSRPPNPHGAPPQTPRNEGSALWTRWRTCSPQTPWYSSPPPLGGSVAKLPLPFINLNFIIAF